VQAGSLQGADGGLAAGARALYVDFDALHAVLHRQAGRGLSGGLGGERSRFPGTAEAQLARAGPGYRVALGIGDGDDGVVERRLDMGGAALDILALAAAADHTLRTFLCHCENPSLLLLVGHGLPGSLAGPGIGLGALASYRKALAVAHTAVAADLDQPLHVEGHVAAQVAFHMAVVVDILSQLGR